MGKRRNRNRKKDRVSKHESNIVKAVQKQFNNQSTTTTTTINSKKFCHFGPKKVLQIGSSNIYGASYNQIVDDWNWGLMVRFGDIIKYSDPDTIRANVQAQAILPARLLEKVIPPIVDITWPDFGNPIFKRDWWELLYKTISEMKPTNVVFHCQGGHGRTGTALAILAALNGEKEPIKFIRQFYCADAVESGEQVEYIEKITGLKLDDQGSFWGGYGIKATYPQTSTHTSVLADGPILDDEDEEYSYSTPDGTKFYWDEDCECFLEKEVYILRKKQRMNKVVEVEYEPEDTNAPMPGMGVT